MKKFNASREKSHAFIPFIHGGDLIENIIVFGVFTVLFVRVFLYLTNSPQLGGESLHIAHMLWGGALMIIALFLLFFFLDKTVKVVASVIAGIGFGLFIDELGKFITKDNDYYFEPTVALIYMVFIVLFLSMRAIEKYFTFTKKDYAVNAVEYFKEFLIFDLDEEEKNEALQLLEKSNRKSPAVAAMKKVLKEAKPIPEKDADIFMKVEKRIAAYYRKLARKTHFIETVMAFFVVLSIGRFLLALYYIDQGLSFWQTGLVLSAVVAGVLAMWGAFLHLKKKRHEAYEYYRNSMLVAIFLFQFFLFYYDPVLAFLGFCLNLSIYLVITYVINQEKKRSS